MFLFARVSKRKVRVAIVSAAVCLLSVHAIPAGAQQLQTVPARPTDEVTVDTDCVNWLAFGDIRRQNACDFASRAPKPTASEQQSVQQPAGQLSAELCKYAWNEVEKLAKRGASGQMLQQITKWHALGCPYPFELVWQSYDDQVIYFDYAADLARRRDGPIAFVRLLKIRPAEHASNIPLSREVHSRTDCKKYELDEIGGNLKCEVLKGQILDAEGRALDAETAALEQETICKRQLLAALKSNKIKLEAVPNPGEACERARLVGLAVQPTPTSAELDTHGIRPATYGSTKMASTGLSYANFDSMRRQGFNATQIMAAIDGQQSLGLDVNDNPAATARLQRDTPWAIISLQIGRAYLVEARALDERAKEAEARGGRASSERLRRQSKELAKKAEEERQDSAERMRTGATRVR